MMNCKMCPIALYLVLTVAVFSPVQGQTGSDQPTAQSIDHVSLNQMLWEKDDRTKIGLLEQYITSYPNDKALPMLRLHLRDAYQRTEQYSKLLAINEKLLLDNPADMETAYASLKVAEQLKDPGAIHQWSSAAFAAAQKASLLPAADKAVASQVAAYSDYLLYSEALQTADSTRKLETLALLCTRSPEGPYTGQAQALRIETYQKLGDKKKALALMDELMQQNSNNEDVLLLLAQAACQRKTEPERTIAYCNKLIAALDRPKPEALSDADWTAKKNRLWARAYWMLGLSYMSIENYAQADRSLRSALPLIHGDDQTSASVLFQLGWANYQLKNMRDALKFNQDCRGLNSTFKEQASRNIAVIQAETAR